MEQLNSKVLLFGEYAVLHQGMALVIPCDIYSGRLDFYEAATNKNFALQSNKFLKKFCEFVAGHMDEEFLLEVKLFERELEQGLFFKSTIPQGYGLGSSGALVAAIFLRYLKKAKTIKDDLKALTFQKLHQLKEGLGKLESYFHGVSSGLDPLSIILNEPILYKNAQDIVTTELPKASEEKKNTIFLINTRHSRCTATMMDRFTSLYDHPDFKKKFDEHVILNNNQAIESFLRNDVESFYRSLYNLSIFQLNEMEDFFPELFRKDMAKGLDNGDYLIKLCGAGGGGFMLGFTQDWKNTKEQLIHYELQPIYNY